ncbi:MAG TPA: hypothetical protein VJQ45_10910 [Ktedonobacterales bacterium]|nr:hypothetical protein [Ktedonobacterales bacterium]
MADAGRPEASGSRKAGAFLLGVALAALPVALAWVGFPALALYDEATRTNESACLATRYLFYNNTSATGLVVGALLMGVLLVIFALVIARRRRFLAYGIATGLVVAPVVAGIGCQLLVQLPCAGTNY